MNFGEIDFIKCLTSKKVLLRKMKNEIRRLIFLNSVKNFVDSKNVYETNLFEDASLMTFL